MKKQLRYPSLVARMFASTIDMTIFTLLTLPFTTFIGQQLFSWYFAKLFSENGVDFRDASAIIKYLSNTGYSNVELWYNFYNYIMVSMVINYLILGVCYCFCWCKWGNSPGKVLTGQRIVDVNSLQKPTNQQFLKRYFGYIFFLFNVIIMPFEKRTRGIQDIMAKTVVIRV